MRKIIQITLIILLISFFPFFADAYTPSNDRTLEADNITTLSTDYVTLKKPIELELESIFTEITTPANPAAGAVKFYPKSDGLFYRLNSAGVESLVGLEFTSVNDNRLVKSSGVTGTAIEESGISIDDSNNMTNVNDLSLNGTTTLNVLLNGPLKAVLGVIGSGNVDLTSEVTGILPIANGGTGSATQNYVDLTTDQTILGNKTFSSTGAIGVPVGTELERPIGAAGLFRLNSDTGSFEGHNGTEWGAIAGGGGAADYNIVIDSSFEKESANGTCTTCTLSYGTTDVSFVSETNTKYARINYEVGETGSYLDSYTINSDLENKQGLIRIIAKTTRDDTFLQVYKDSVAGTSEGIDQITLDNDGEWHKYELPFVYGSTNIGYKIDSTTASDLDIDIDLSYVGLTPDGFANEISEAHFVGGQLSSNASCSWVRTAATWGPFGVDADCNYSNNGGILSPSTNLPAITIPSVRTDGTYMVTAKSTFRNNSSSGGESCAFSLSSSDLFEEKQVVDTNGAEDRRQNAISASFSFNTSGDKQIQVIAISSTAQACQVLADNSRDRSLIFDVEFFPNESSTIVAQQKELTVYNKNDFSISVNPASNTILKDDFGVFSSCTLSGAQLTCVYNVGVFTLAPTLTGCTLQNASGSSTSVCEIQNSSNVTQLVLKLEEHGSGLGNYIGTRVDFGIEKTGADINKSIEVIGAFRASSIKDGVSSPNSGTGKAKICSWTETASVVAGEVGDCIDNVTNGSGGQMQFNFNASYWSDNPNCTCTAAGLSGERSCSIVTRTDAYVNTSTKNGATDIDISRFVMCHGIGN